TRPPMRNGRDAGASFAATCDGVKKNTRFDWNAFSTSATATPRTTTPAPIHRKRRCRWASRLRAHAQRVERALAPRTHRDDLDDDREGGHAVRHPDVPRVTAH